MMRPQLHPIIRSPAPRLQRVAGAGVAEGHPLRRYPIKWWIQISARGGARRRLQPVAAKLTEVK